MDAWRRGIPAVSLGAFEVLTSVVEPLKGKARPLTTAGVVRQISAPMCVQDAPPDKAPRLDAEPVPYGAAHFFVSYMSLAPKYGFYSYGGRDFADAKWYRTTPGEFGARASKLYKLLSDGHHDLVLPPEDLHRLVLWLDSCSLFYGVYEKEGGLAQLRGEIPQPTLQ